MKFSPDSKKFVAAYHYSHKGDCTWMVVWEIGTEGFLSSMKKQVFFTIIPDDIFKE